MKTKHFSKILILLVLSVFLSSCSLDFSKTYAPKKQVKTHKKQSQKTPKSKEPKLVDKKNNKLQKFKNLEELKKFLNKKSFNSGAWRGGRVGYSFDKEDVIDFDTVTNSALGREVRVEKKSTGELAMPTSASPSAKDYSKTNIQVEGVDEADIIKTDGKNIYALVNKDLFIVLAYPAKKAEVLSKISFKSRPQDIYVNGDFLVVFGYDTYLRTEKRFAKMPWRNSTFTFFKVFDISDPKNPKQNIDLDFKGNYTDSRMIGDYVYFLTQDYNYSYRDDVSPLPIALRNGDVIEERIMPNVYYFDCPYYSYNFLTVASINIKNPKEKPKREFYIMPSNQKIYVSQKNLYITYTQNINEEELAEKMIIDAVYPLLKKEDKEKIDKIMAVDDFILNEREKNEKVMLVIFGSSEYLKNINNSEKFEDEIEKKIKDKISKISLQNTIIHKIAIKNGNLNYVVKAQVPGRVLNQFSMDEKDGYFRIATTKDRSWSVYLDEEEKKSYNNLYVLDENLKQVGALDHLAPEEKIYSVRFMQNRAYMVTFKQMDPLFVIDLSNPREPKVLGKLKIPGYSDYLHPYDKNTLIGFGKDTGENKWGGVSAKGLKLSLFDVSDVSRPKEIDTYIMGDAGSDSIALHDHKAFLFSKEKHLLAIPVAIREKQGEGYWGKITFNGAMIFNVDKNGFELKGKIDHNDKNSDSGRVYGKYYYDNSVKRILYLDDKLYTFSNKYIKINNISNLDLVYSLPLLKEESSDYKIVN